MTAVDHHQGLAAHFASVLTDERATARVRAQARVELAIARQTVARLRK